VSLLLILGRYSGELYLGGKVFVDFRIAVEE